MRTRKFTNKFSMLIAAAQIFCTAALFLSVNILLFILKMQ